MSHTPRLAVVSIKSFSRPFLSSVFFWPVPRVLDFVLGNACVYLCYYIAWIAVFIDFSPRPPLQPLSLLADLSRWAQIEILVGRGTLSFTLLARLRSLIVGIWS